MADRDIRDKIFCRLHGKDTPKEYSVEDALAKVDRLVWKTAQAFHYKISHLDLDDMYQQGRIGVLTAWAKFDENKGTAFITYANWWVLKFIQTFCAAFEFNVSLNSQNQKLYKEMCNDQGMSSTMRPTQKNKALALLAKGNNGLTKKLDKDEFAEEDEGFEHSDDTHAAEITDKILLRLRKELPLKEYYIVIGLSGLMHDQPLTVTEISERMDVPREFVRRVRTQRKGIVAKMLEDIGGLD